MQTHFLTLTLDLQDVSDLQQSILAALRQEGEPLRWAITQVDPARRKIQVEAVITRSEVWSMAGAQVITV